MNAPKKLPHGAYPFDGPYWDKRTERWLEIREVRDERGRLVIVQHREVPNPETGVIREPPAGVTTRPKNR